ncbi:MAG: hypothetical protein JWQ02_3119 [Capsulimonas sp.]|nr:hypothetical protein [Capsulimonas sp.]
MTRFSWKIAACAALALASFPHSAVRAADQPQGIFIEPSDGDGKRVYVAPMDGQQHDVPEGMVVVTAPPIDTKKFPFFGHRNAALCEVADVKTDAPKTEQNGRTSVAYHLTLKVVETLRPLAQPETSVEVDIVKPSNAHSFLSQWLPVTAGAQFVAAFDNEQLQDAFNQDASSESKQLTPLAFDRTVKPNWRDMTLFNQAISQTSGPIPAALAQPVLTGAAGHLYFQLIDGYSSKVYGVRVFTGAFIRWLQNAKVPASAKAEIVANYLSTPINVTKAANPATNRAVAVAGAAAILSVSRSADRDAKDQLGDMLRAYCELFLMNDRPRGVTASALAPADRRQLAALAQRRAGPEERPYYAAWLRGK